jgi:hypothetical protein
MAESKSADLPLVDTPTELTKNVSQNVTWPQTFGKEDAVQNHYFRSLHLGSFFWTESKALLYRLSNMFWLLKGVFVHLSKKLLALSLALVSLPALAIPIDWNGSLAFDTIMLNNFRRTNDAIAKAATPAGTQGIKSGDDSALFHSYIFKLNPHLIVNDAVSVKGELSTGYARGGLLGDNTTQNQAGRGTSAYYNTVPAQRSDLNVNQLYAELYADTALVKVGRYAKGYALGAVLNEGRGTFDRFYTQYDGLEGQMRIGNFTLTPHWARLNSYGTGTAGADRNQPNGQADAREMGLIAAYDNKSTNTVASVAYTKRSNEPNALYRNNDAGSADPASVTDSRGSTDVTLIDVYFSKSWEKFDVKFEVPILSGQFGNIYDDGNNSSISSTAILFESNWRPGKRWEYGFHAGQVGGDNGATSTFEGFQLNPNYHVAELMFRYNYSAFNEARGSIFDSGITNARFFKLHAHYKTDKWTWSMAAIMATAMETAKSGSKAWHHEEAYRFDALADQTDDYGTEIDLGFNYQWNPNVNVSGFLAYWLVGDYYTFSNSATKIATTNVLGAGLRLGIDF